jgi:HEAT repeat protein
MTKPSPAIKAILKDLQANDPKIVLDAISRNRKDGDENTFRALLNTLKATDEPDVEAAIIQFLYDLKDEKSIPVLIEAIQDMEMSYYHSFLVAAFWQAAIDGSEHLDVFVKAAINGEYMTSLEALTVIENFDSAFAQSELENYVADINVAIEEEENEEKKKLLQSLVEVIGNLPVEGE